MTNELIQTESWLAEYLILEKRIGALYKQAERPQLRDMFLKMAPKGDKNMAVDTDKVNVQGGNKPIPWAANLETIYAKVKEISQDISDKIMACVEQQTDMRCAVDRARLTHEEYLYVEQRYFLGMSVKEMERDGCMATRLKQIKRSALEKISVVRGNATQNAAKSG